MRTRRVRGTALLVTAVTLLLAAGCSAGGSAARTPGLEKPDLTVAVVPAVDSAGFFIALEDGLFKAQGLSVTFKPAISSATVINQQAEGKIDITGGSYVSYIQAQSNWDAGMRPSPSSPHVLAANVDIFAEGSRLQPGVMGLYTMPGSPIQTLAQLKGRTIGNNAPQNLSWMVAVSVLTEHGISPGDVHFVVAKGGFPKMPAELKAGAFSAVVLNEPFGSVAALSDGAVMLADFDQGTTINFPVEGYVVTKQWAQKYPRTLSAFYKALEEGQQIADTSREAVEAAFESLPSPLGLPKVTAAVMALESYPVSTGPAGSVDTAQLKRVVGVMQQFIGFDQAFNIDSMLMGVGFQNLVMASDLRRYVWVRPADAHPGRAAPARCPGRVRRAL
jgi:NitT/TauT family transport system substrate-binding protein